MTEQRDSLARLSPRQLTAVALQLPVLYSMPLEVQAEKRYPAWTSIIYGQRVIAMAALPDVLWCLTSRGILRRQWGKLMLCTWYGSEHGLPGTQFDQIVIDGEGRPWVASKNLGVSYWDGHFWHPFTSENSLPSSFILDMATDSQGKVWISTDKGLGYVEWRKEVPVWFTYDLSPARLPAPKVACFSFNNQQKPILGTAWGLYCPSEDEAAWERFTIAKGLPSNQITALMSLPDQTIMVGTTQGMARLTSDGLTPVSGITDTIYAFYHDPQYDTVWVFTSEGLWHNKDERFERFEIPQLEQNGRRPKTIATNAGKMWIGSDLGVLEYNPTPALIRAPGERDFPDVGITNISVDDQNNLWVGTASGLWVLKNHEWRSFQPGNQLINPITNVNGIVTIGDELVWVGSWQKKPEGGLRLFRKGIEIRIPHRKALESVDVITLDSDHKLWVASEDTLYQQNGEEWNQIASPDPESLFLSLLIDHANRIWCGMKSGLFVRKQNRWHKVQERIEVNVLQEHAEGTIWVGTSQGVFTIKDKKPETLNIQLPSNRVQALYLSGSTVWIGTSAGLVRYCNESVQSWNSMNSGLAGNNVKALALDSENNLWVGTSSGLSHFNLSIENQRAGG